MPIFKVEESDTGKHWVRSKRLVPAIQAVQAFKDTVEAAAVPRRGRRLSLRRATAAVQSKNRTIRQKTKDLLGVQNQVQPDAHAAVDGIPGFGLVAKETTQSFTRQLAFNDDYKRNEELASSDHVGAFYNDYRSNLIAKIATLMIFGVTALLLIVFWWKNKQLEHRFEDMENKNKEEQLMGAILHANTTLDQP